MTNYRQPIVVKNGDLEQLQSGDGLDLSNYQLPADLGTFDQYLAIPVSGTILEWRDLPKENPIINGAFAIAQRGTSFSISGSATYTLDRWAANRTSNLNISQQNPGLDNFAFCIRVGRPPSDVSVDDYGIYQVIETINCQHFANQQVTVSAYIRAGSDFTNTNFYMRIFTGSGTDEGLSSLLSGSWTSLANTYTTISPTTGWVRYSFVTTIPSGTKEIALQFLCSGPTGTAGANDYFEVTGVQIGFGASLAAFNHRSINEELVNCQRYYTFLNTSFRLYLSGPSQPGIGYNFGVPIRTAPSVIYISGPTSSANINPSYPHGTFYATGIGGTFGIVPASTGDTYLYHVQWAFDAEL
jgi:hypothetical protein